MRTKENSTPAFLAGGGEMGELTRSFDWSKTSVGIPDTWPQSLRTIISIILNSKFPMFLWWGPDLICFYNDAYRPSLGQNGKHPAILGMKAEEAWEEIWHIIKPMIDQVMDGGESTWRDDQLVPIFRNGRIEDVYWTYSYSAVQNEAGNINGVLVTVIETTKTVKAVKALEESERRFQNLVREANVGIIVLSGEEMRVDVVNEAYGRLIALKPDDLLGKPLFDLIPEAEDVFFPILNKVRLTGETLNLYEQPYHVVTKGEKIDGYLNVIYQAYKEADGAISGVTVLCQDITETIKNRKKIEESEKQFRNFADSIQNLAWIANSDGWRYWYNQQWYDYTGTTLEETEGWEWEKMLHPDHLIKVTAFAKEAWKKDEAYELTFPLRRHDGEYRWFLTRAFPVKDTDGNIERWIGTHTDIDDQVRMQQKKDEFISIASHEMRTPLTIAKSYNELLLLSLNADNQRSFLYATKTNKAIERLNSLIIELLDASKIQNGQLNYTLTNFDLNQLLDETIETIQNSSINHTVQKTGSCSQQINGDRDRVQQVLTNLLSNAVKYSPNADKVLVKIEEQDNKIQISVQDFGIGMTAPHLNKVFERYYRAQEHAVHYQGLGIGLYIAHNIVERHGGRMWAESEPEKGSTFYFTLPL